MRYDEELAMSITLWAFLSKPFTVTVHIATFSGEAYDTALQIGGRGVHVFSSKSVTGFFSFVARKLQYSTG